MKRTGGARSKVWRTAATLALALGVAGAAGSGTWVRIAADGVHDPASPGLRLLQNPEEALALLPGDTAGNQVDWIKALEHGMINPRSTVHAATPVRIRTTEILLRNTSQAHMVRFPHRQHTAWVDCVSCHSGLFEMNAGATKLTGMFPILSGEKCGRCHGAVAFPLTECARCHSVARGSEEEKAFGGKLVREAQAP